MDVLFCVEVLVSNGKRSPEASRRTARSFLPRVPGAPYRYRKKISRVYRFRRYSANASDYKFKTIWGSRNGSCTYLLMKLLRSRDKNKPAIINYLVGSGNSSCRRPRESKILQEILLLIEN